MTTPRAARTVQPDRRHHTDLTPDDLEREIEQLAGQLDQLEKKMPSPAEIEHWRAMAEAALEQVREGETEKVTGEFPREIAPLEMAMADHDIHSTLVVGGTPAVGLALYGYALVRFPSVAWYHPQFNSVRTMPSRRHAAMA